MIVSDFVLDEEVCCNIVHGKYTIEYTFSDEAKKK